MTRFDFHMEMEPILARVDRSSFHQRFQHFRRSSSRTFGPDLTSVPNRPAMLNDEMPPTEYTEAHRHRS